MLNRNWFFNFTIFFNFLNFNSLVLYASNSNSNSQVQSQIQFYATKSEMRIQTLNAPSTSDSLHPLIIGHRGASGYRPEHTLESYSLAIEMGADYIEPDLVLTKDGIMVARHEPMIGATTDVSKHSEFISRKRKEIVDGIEYFDWFVSDFTLAEIKSLHAVQARSNRDQSYNGIFQIPTFTEVLNLAQEQSKIRGRTIGIYPEIKHSTYHSELRDSKKKLLFGKYFFENLLIKIIEENNSKNFPIPVFIQSFEVSNLQYLKSKTKIPLVQLVDGSNLSESGEVQLNPPSHKPYDFVLNKDPRTYRDLLTDSGLAFVKTYAEVVAPWKPYLVKTIEAMEDVNHDGVINDQDRKIVGTTGLVERAHQQGLKIHTWTFRKDDKLYGFDDPIKEIQYYLSLGVDGVFTDFPDIGVAARINLNPNFK